MSFGNPSNQWAHPRMGATRQGMLGAPGQSARDMKTRSRSRSRSVVTRLFGSGPEIEWHSDLFDLDETANLSDQHPATLYYLALVKDIPLVSEVYVEELDHGRRKHWTVISKRDYAAMDDIYDLEEDTLDRFPEADLSFRTTIQTDGGPSVSTNATKIFDKS